MKTVFTCEAEELCKLSSTVRELCEKKEYKRCLPEICQAMGKFPDSAVPNNLYGVVLELSGDHLGAMKHFRAAWSLDPTYSPANQNLEIYGTFLTSGKPAFDEHDVTPKTPAGIVIVYDEHGVGHAVRKTRKTATVIDRRGVAHTSKGDLK